MAVPAQRSAGRRLVLSASAMVVVLIFGIAGYLGWQRLNPGRGEFPGLSAGLSARQKSILAVARTEWQTPGAPTRYSQGVEEEWCADFVSWVVRKAGYPMSNPNSGSWRIPGVLTLQSYLTTTGRFHPVGDGYRPQPADIVIYDGGSWGQHTNLVVSTRGNRITTVGGNQNAGIGIQTISVRESDLNATGVIGYGAA
ncbi:MAG: CHAP domain-containing protein [Allobranchiibius sp.]